MTTLALASNVTPDSLAEIALRLGAALALGAVCGWDREREGRPAGLRTYMMVSLGAAMFTILGLELLDALRAEDGTITYDPSRIIAGIVTGIGFLGAGTIIQAGKEITGLTTAAGLWVIAGVGIACGSGMFAFAAIAAGGVLVVLIVMGQIEHHLKAKSNDGEGQAGGD